MTDLLDEMVYSGDIEGFIKRRSKEVLQDDFLQYLEEKIETSDDDDEKAIFSEALQIIEERQRLTDGLGEAVDVVFETRLDKILFTSPNLRTQWIEAHLDEITPGFVEYVQKELRKMEDEDSKVSLLLLDI